MAEEIIIAEQQLDFMYNEDAGIWVSGIAEIAALPETGTKLAVCFDKAEYACTVNYDEAMGALWAGNGSLFGLEGGEDVPFLISFAEDDGVSFAAFVTAETGESHTVSIGIAKEADGIVLKDPLGRSITYGEYSKIKLTRASGIQSIFSEGEAEAKEISTLDFKDVNEMVVTPDEKKLFSEVTIIKPAALLPENIAEGIEIAGITGTFVGSEDPVLNLEATELSFTLDEDFGKYMYTGEGITYIIPDANYTVTYNETSYDIKSVWVESFNSAILGNTAFWGGEDTGHPFMIAVNDSKDMWVVDMYSQPESVNMAVSLVTETQTGGSSTLELEETTLEFTDVGYAYGYITDETFPDIRAGASYTVTWDGTEYACTALEVDGDVIMGNFIPLTGVDTGEPFIYLPNMATGEGTVLYSVYDTAEATHTVSIRLNFVSSDPVYTMDTTTLTFADAGGIYQCIQNLPITHVLDGANYIVTIDGTEYSTKGYVTDDRMLSLIGNGSMLDSESFEDTGEPFVILLQLGIKGIITTLAGESHDISVALNFEGDNSGSGDDNSVLYSLLDGSITEITDENIQAIGAHALSYKTNLTQVNFPNAVSVGSYAFNNCKALATVILPSATTIGEYAFYFCTALKNVELPSLLSVPRYLFQYSGVVSVKIPAATTLESRALQGADGTLTTVDTSALTSISSQAFYWANVLKALILRNTETVCSLGTNAFQGCYHILGTTNATYNPTGAKDGYIYVPSALVDSYKAATNWSTYASQFRALEDYTVDGTTTGELDETKI